MIDFVSIFKNLINQSLKSLLLDIISFYKLCCDLKETFTPFRQLRAEAASTKSRRWTRTRDQAVQSPTTFRYTSTITSSTLGMFLCSSTLDQSSWSGVRPRGGEVVHIWTQQLTPACTVVEHMGSLHPDGHQDRLGIHIWHNWVLLSVFIISPFVVHVSG